MSLIEHVFSPEMMNTREEQLILALLDCAGVYYDVNFTRDRILGEPIQIVEGKAYPILEQIGKAKNCTYTEIIDYWEQVMPPEEAAPFVAFSQIDRMCRCYEEGQRVVSHKFWSYDVLGNRMLAEQKVRLYRDHTTGDLLGLVYVSNGGENEMLRRKEAQLNEQYREASQRLEIFQNASVNLPGGYHRCGVEKGTPFLFVSNSFERMVGYTRQQLEKELDGLFVNLVLPEDRPLFDRLEQDIRHHGNASATYRIRRRDGRVRWMQGSGMLVNWDGVPCLQCTIADITDFVIRQEELTRKQLEFETIAETIPCGYHRCSTADGFLLEFVSDSFLDVVGYTREELIGKPFMELIAPEDRAFFMSHEPELIRNGKVELAYRLLRKDGSVRWIQDSTARIQFGGKDTYQCTLADITEFVRQQEEMMKNNLALTRQRTMMETMESNMPAGYHRCKVEEGCPFLFIGRHFTDIVGFTKEEIQRDLGNLYRNLIWPEDIAVMETYENMGALVGKGNSYDTSIYRIKHKDGGYRWVTDSTMFMDLGEDSFFQSTIADITEFIDSMNEAKERAEASSQAKSTFLFNASHDIRTPMNAIKGFAHIIAQNKEDPQVVGEAIGKIQLASDTLMTLMNDVLDLARIERGKEELNLEPIQVIDHGRSLVEMFQPEMEKAGITFTGEAEVTHSLVLADPLKLTRVGMNMLSNAKKFTPPGGTVTFGVRETACDGEQVTYRFYTRDTGVGMSPEFLKRAFEQFERERTSTESGVAGSGLGLAIIKTFVELMGGTVDITSRLGEGTEISATLTFRLVQEPEAREGSQEQELLSLAGKRVLLVEDNDFNREIARYVLEGMGLAVEEAVNGADAVGRLREAGAGHFDMILMDIQMPVMDGYGATREIRALEDRELAATPIIAMTANAFDEDKQKCLAVGMNGHIGKPIGLEVLAKTLSGLL